jgi:hypothetical protein
MIIRERDNSARITNGSKGLSSPQTGAVLRPTTDGHALSLPSTCVRSYVQSKNPDFDFFMLPKSVVPSIPTAAIEAFTSICRIRVMALRVFVRFRTIVPILLSVPQVDFLNVGFNLALS